MSISDNGQASSDQANITSKSGRFPFQMVSDLKPNTASGAHGVHSAQRLESVEEVISKKQ